MCNVDARKIILIVTNYAASHTFLMFQIVGYAILYSEMLGDTVFSYRKFPIGFGFQLNTLR